MIQTIRKAWGIPELRKKIIFTLLILLIFRIGNAITVPYVDVGLLETYLDQMGGTILGLYNVMSGGAFAQATVFALSIQPYINASIIIQLLTVAIPALERLAKDGGEEGRKKIQSITRYTTVGIAILQAVGYYFMMRNYNLLASDATGIWPALVIVVSFIAGSSFVMWMGEQVTEFGIGNGISIILFAGILSRIPTSVSSLYSGVVSWANGGAAADGALHPALVVFCLLLALLLAAGVAYQTNWGKYQFAQLCMTTSHYGKAMDTFADLKGYEDSADKETDARYQLAMQHMEKGKYQKAAFHLRKLGDYQDSETQLVTAETQLLQGAQVGDTVPFGTCDWVVLDAQSDGALLTLEKPLKEPQCFNEQKAEVSWTDASLCRWLNDRWMTETFSAEEQAMLRDSDAKSKVFLLSDAEWRSYGSQIKPVKCNWWLRTPSTQKGCAMFVDPYGTIMEAGYPVNAVMKVRPTVWVSYQ